VLISDGVIELRNISGQEYGTERLIDSLERHADLSCERLVDAIDQDNIRFSGEGLATDDRSIVIVTRQIC
jgi:phosphoserine phosphatase RsbU/P